MPSLFRSPNCAPKLQPPSSTPKSRARFSYWSRVAGGSVLRHPQIVALDQNAVFGDVRNIDRVLALIENIAEGDVHAALGREADAGLLAHFVEPLAVVKVKFRNAVIVGDKQVGMPGAAQVCGRSGQRPAAAVDAKLWR